MKPLKPLPAAYDQHDQFFQCNQFNQRDQWFGSFSVISVESVVQRPKLNQRPQRFHAPRALVAIHIRTFTYTCNLLTDTCHLFPPLLPHQLQLILIARTGSDREQQPEAFSGIGNLIDKGIDTIWHPREKRPPYQSHWVVFIDQRTHRIIQGDDEDLVWHGGLSSFSIYAQCSVTPLSGKIHLPTLMIIKIIIS